jgi:hypothetical protein
LNPRDIIVITFCFIQKFRVSDVIQHCPINIQTAIDWYSFCREVCKSALDMDNRVVGGRGQIVEIDETHITTSKYNRGRPSSCQKRKIQIFGAFCRETKLTFVRVVNKCDKETIWPLILDHNAPGSIIHSDGAAIYRNLCTPEGRQYGFDFEKHEAVIHKDGEYVRWDDVLDEMITTNGIENFWRWLKPEIVSHSTEQVIESYAMQYLFFKEKCPNQQNGKKMKVAEKFWIFMESVKELYPIAEYGLLHRV